MDYLELNDPQDIAFSKIAQGARVDGATLPSGLKVPVTPGSMWIIRGQFVYNETPRQESPKPE